MWQGLPRLLRVALLALLIATAACDDEDEEKADARLPPEAQIITLGDMAFSNHGTRDVTGMTELRMEADQYYFAPTFLQGAPGQRLTLTIENEDNRLVHNFSLPAQQIDRDIPIDGAEIIDVVFPESGALLFLCKYHSSSGMNGELLAGDATPQAPR